MVKLPSEEKIEWMVKNVPAHEKDAMLKDLLLAAKKACETSNLNRLAETIADWEATVEVYKDPNFKKIVEGHKETAEGNPEFAKSIISLVHKVLFRDEEKQ